MRVHTLYCTTLCPIAGGLLGEPGLRPWQRGHWPCLCLLVETPRDGLVLIDTGVGTAECAEPSKVPVAARFLTGPRFDASECAVAKVRALGHSPSDVRHVVVTHLDFDHAGGLADFPEATVHVHERELFGTSATWFERVRYVPRQWEHVQRWAQYATAGDRWYGLDAVRTLQGVQADIALVPLFGHTRGHSGVAVRSDDGWMLHAGDAFFRRVWIEEPERVPRGLAWFEEVEAFDRTLRRRNLDQLRRIHSEHADEVTLLCSHEPLPDSAGSTIQSPP